MILPVMAFAASSLVSAIWQGSLLALCVAGLLRLLPGTSAALRSFLWTVVFGALVVLHFASLQLKGMQSHGLHASSGWGMALALLWLGCSLFRALQFGVGLHHLYAVLHRAKPILAHPGSPDAPRSYRVCISPDVDRPSVAGFFSPRVLLPPGLAETLTPDSLEHVLLHEVEHIRRWDDWANLMQKLALVLFPLNPVLAWVERRLCLERELACDDRVVAATGTRKAYAQCLAQLAEHTLSARHFSLALGLLERSSELAIRVRRILAKPAGQMRPAALRATAGVLVAGLTGSVILLSRAPELVSFQPETLFLPASNTSVAAPSFASHNAQQIAPPGQLLRTGTRQDHSARQPQFQLASEGTSPSAKGAPHVSPQIRTISRHKAGLARPFPSLSVAWRSQDQVRWKQVADLDTDQGLQMYTPALFRMPVAYAAVATPEGWIIIQL